MVRYVEKKKEKLKFDGKSYGVVDVSTSKQEAKRIAAQYRKQGACARVVKRTGRAGKKAVWVYGIFVRMEK